MKGDPAFSREPVRRVFRGIGALLCWRLELEWASKRRFDTPVHEQLLPSLQGGAGEGSETGKTWRRWRDFANTESAFASGQLTTAGEVAAWAVSQHLIDADVGAEFVALVALLHDLGAGHIAPDDDGLESGLDRGYAMVFALADIEPTDHKVSAPIEF